MFCGGINLPKFVPFLGNSQFKCLCAISTICMAITVFISVAAIPERDPRQEPEHPDANQGLLFLFRSLWHSLFHLPPQITKVCRVQFMAWMGWFPFLFYTTTYIGEIYVEPFFEENPNMSKTEIDQLWEAGTRRGTVALLMYAIVTFAASVILPFLIPPTYKVVDPIQAPTTPLTSSYMSSSNSFPTSRRRSTLSSTLGLIQSSISTLLTKLQIPSLTLRRTWLYSHLLFCFCMWSTLIVRSVPLATFLITLVGIPWAVTMWAPFALISAEISKRDAIRRGIIPPPPTAEGAFLAANEDDSADQAGVVLGIHNVAISAPQVMATVFGSVLFKWLQKPRGAPGDESVAWFFRVGGLCALYAAYLTTKVGEEADTTRRREEM
jgi:solute carrier family 45, member 1/2/4